MSGGLGGGDAHNYASIGASGISRVPNLEEELSIDKSTLETIKALYAAKERAV